MIIKDKKLKKQLDKVPDADENGNPIFKIAGSDKRPRRDGKGGKSK
jgi:hypothetical protein